MSMSPVLRRLGHSVQLNLLTKPNSVVSGALAVVHKNIIIVPGIPERKAGCKLPLLSLFSSTRSSRRAWRPLRSATSLPVLPLCVRWSQARYCLGAAVGPRKSLSMFQYGVYLDDFIVMMVCSCSNVLEWLR